MVICYHGLILRNGLECSGLSRHLTVIVEQRLVILGLSRTEARILGDRCIGAGLASHCLEGTGRLRSSLLIAETRLE